MFIVVMNPVKMVDSDGNHATSAMPESSFDVAFQSKLDNLFVTKQDLIDYGNTNG